MFAHIDSGQKRAALAAFGLAIGAAIAFDLTWFAAVTLLAPEAVTDGTLSTLGVLMMAAAVLVGALLAASQVVAASRAGEALRVELHSRVLAGEAALDTARAFGLTTEIGHVEALAGGPATMAVLGAAELVLAATLAVLTAPNAALPVLVAAGVGTTLALGVADIKRCADWTVRRSALTAATLERLLGHRTRLVQGHQEADACPPDYRRSSARFDHSGWSIAEVLPVAWLLCAVGTMAFNVEALDANSAIDAAASIVFFSFALRRLGTGIHDSVPAVVALWHLRGHSAGSAQQDTASALPTPVLEPNAGSFIALEAPSGSGTTTFLSHLGTQTRFDAVACPPLEQNYLFNASLAFNLLIGRAWPPTAADLEDAEAICRRLGLGPVLDRMPAGLDQPVGDCGWQLSHGEMTLILVARTLLQNRSAVLLDKPLDALDPESAKRLMETIPEHTAAAIVATHPRRRASHRQPPASTGEAPGYAVY